jgi:hypothetical protein
MVSPTANAQTTATNVQAAVRGGSRRVAQDAHVNPIASYVIVLLPILISIKLAKDNRKSCDWSASTAANKTIAAGLMILLSLLAGLQNADAFSVFGIGRALLLWCGVYQLSRAIFRRRDLKSQLVVASVSSDR